MPEYPTFFSMGVTWKFCQLLSIYSVGDNSRTITGYWWRKPTSSEGNLSPWHSVHHKSHVYCSGFELGAPPWQGRRLTAWTMTRFQIQSRYNVISWADTSFGIGNGKFSHNGRVTCCVDVMVKPVTDDTDGQWQPAMGAGLGQNGRVGRVSPAGAKYSST